MTRTTVRMLLPQEYDIWVRLVSSAPAGSPYALPDYLDALCAAAGGTFAVHGAFRGDELVGGLAAYERVRGGKRYLAPRLLLYYNGPVFREFPTRYPSQQSARQHEALAALGGMLGAARYASVTVKSPWPLQDVRPLLASGWHAWPSYTYVVSLTSLPDQWHRVEQNLRRLIDRARSRNLSFSDDDDFASFFSLHASTLARRGAAPYLPERPFSGFFHRLRQKGLVRLFHARLPGGQAVASQLVLTGPHRCSHTVAAASDPEHNDSGASAFLRWSSFEVLAGLGYAENDLTDAALNPVTHFKAQLGGDLRLALVLERPARLGWRAARLAEDMAVRTKTLAGGIWRRLVERTQP